MTTQAIIEQPRQVVAQPQKSVVPSIATGAPGCPALSLALSQARDRCKAATKSSKHHLGYWYASADTVIATASAAMEGTGLSLIPVTEELVVLGNSVFALNRVMFLTHQSGEHVPLEVRGWPVIPDKGRPLDKAFAIAITSSLAYKLRDLLQMPRGDGDDMSSRIDEEEPATAPAPNSQPPTITPEQKQALMSIAQSKKRSPQEVSLMLASLEQDLHTIDQLPRVQFDWATAILNDGQISTEQADRIVLLLEQKNLDWTAITAKLEQKYGVNRLRLLTTTQAGEIEKALTEKRS